MKNTEQALNTAIGELNCLRPGSPAALDELHALSIARDCIQVLLRSCVNQMRTDPDALQSWPDIAYALGSDSANAVRQRFGAKTPTADEHVESFWNSHAGQFAWNFLPSGFLHQLYTSWLCTNSDDSLPMTAETFTRRVKAVATASGDWVHVRTRPHAYMSSQEPLLDQIPHWSPPHGNRALHGFLRNGV